MLKILLNFRTLSLVFAWDLAPRRTQHLNRTWFLLLPFGTFYLVMIGWVPWVPETFLARFPVSVKSLKWPARKASGAERYCFDGADPIVSTVKLVGPDLGGGGSEGFFWVSHFGQKGFFWVYERRRDFFGSRKQRRDFFWYCIFHQLK